MIQKAIKKLSDRLTEKKVIKYREQLKDKTNEIYKILESIQSDVNTAAAIASHLEVIANLMVHFKASDRPFIVGIIIENIKNVESKKAIGLKPEYKEKIMEMDYIG